MKYFLSAQPVVRFNRAAVIMEGYIAVAVAEGISHFRKHGAQIAVAVQAEPEAYRVKHVTEQAGKRQKDNAAIGLRNIPVGKNLPYPRFYRFAIRMIALMEAEQVTAIDGNQPAFDLRKLIERKAQVIHA